MFIFGIFSFLCACLANTIVTHFICRILIVKVKHAGDVAHTAPFCGFIYGLIGRLLTSLISSSNLLFKRHRAPC